MNEQQLKVEVIKALIQTSSDDAKSVLFYGTVAIGLITFTLPHLLDSPLITKTYYQLILFSGVGGLVLGSIFFFWLSRKITRQGVQFGGLLKKIVVTQNFDTRKLNEDIKDNTLFAKKHIRVMNWVAKILGGGGLTLYLGVIIFYLIEKI